jgi:hypothetical protein
MWDTTIYYSVLLNRSWALCTQPFRTMPNFSVSATITEMVHSSKDKGIATLQLQGVGSFSSRCMKVWTNVMSIIFLSIYNNYNGINIDHGYILYKAFHNVSSFINTLFLTLNDTLFASCVTSNSLLKHRSPSCMPGLSSSLAEQHSQSLSFMGVKEMEAGEC